MPTKVYFRITRLQILALLILFCGIPMAAELQQNKFTYYFPLHFAVLRLPLRTG